MTDQRDLTVGLLQTDLAWENPAENITRIEGHMAQLNPQVDLIVLPEMWATGFTMRPDACGMALSSGWEQSRDTWPAPIQAMHRWAKTANAAVVGSLACGLIDEKAAVNRCFFVRPDGSMDWYDKRHTFTFAGENAHYRSGTARVEVVWKGWRILLQTCYDLRFPVFSRNRVSEPYDLAVYVANWPAVRRSAWSALLPARAIENQAYVVGVNRVGEDGNGIEHNGGSALFDPFGNALTSAPDHEEGWAVAQCALLPLEQYREKFPVLKDGDSFKLGN